MMKKKPWLLAIAGASIAVGSASVVGIATMAAGDAAPDFTGLHAAQKSPIEARDGLPSILLDSGNSDDLDLDTARFLGKSELAQYWSVLHEDGWLCLVVAPAHDEVVLGSCARAVDQFAQHGIFVSLQDPKSDASFAAYLLPDTVSSAKTPGDATRVADNLIEIRSVNDGSAPLTVSHDGATVKLSGVEAVGD